MMNNTKTAGSLTKVRKLISVLQKCNGKESVGNSKALVSPQAAKALAVIGVVLLIGLLGVISYLIEPVIAPFISLQSFAQSLMMIMLLMSFVLSIKNIVTVLYTADDLPVLLPMPFSASQIVIAKLAVSSRFPVVVSLVLMNSTCLGFGIHAGMGVPYIIGTVLSSFLIPLTGLALAALLVVIVFRVFGFIRNRDITMVLGGIFTLALIVAYIFVSNSLNDSDSQTAASALTALASVSAGFPNIAFMSSFMFDGSIIGLLISIGVTVAVMALAMLAIKLFYLSTALAMQNTGSTKKAVKKEALAGKKKSGIRKALTDYEARNTRRNPAYMIYGFAMSFIWPLLVGVSLFLGKNSLMDSLAFPLDTRSAILSALLLGITASCFACGFNVLAVTAFSREGDTFSMLRTMPFDFREYYKSKRNFAMLICLLGSVGYIVIIGIVCLATGILTVGNCWVILYSALISFLLDLILVNWMLLNNSKKPYFNWDSETEISRKLSGINIVAIIVGVFAEVFFLVAVSLSKPENDPMVTPVDDTVTTIITIASVAVLAIVLVLAFAVNKYSVKKAAGNLTGIE